MSTEISESDIRSRAYELWRAAGSPEGQDEDFWHEARTKLKQPEANEEPELNDAVKEGTHDKDARVTAFSAPELESSKSKQNP
ncbi:hypothetical protein P3T18_001203 [Paraburkholderia sp. GAS199]|uniref:DUF2934 domain-containing protein n=1 Tax=Paraburkholderia sp. GAS199 TaxID=3035126 RepID=UPI003D22089C